MFALAVSIAREIFSPCKLISPSKTSVVDGKISNMKGEGKSNSTW